MSKKTYCIPVKWQIRLGDKHIGFVEYVFGGGYFSAPDTGVYRRRRDAVAALVEIYEESTKIGGDE